MGLANILSFSRLPLALAIVVFSWRDNQFLALLLLGLMVLTDIFDGIIARKNKLTRQGVLVDALVDYACIIIIIPSLILLRSGSLFFSGVVTVVLAGIGVYYYSRLKNDVKMHGTQLGKPVMSIAVFAVYINLIVGVLWEFSLSIAAILFFVNSILFLKGVYKKQDSKKRRKSKNRA